MFEVFFKGLLNETPKLNSVKQSEGDMCWMFWSQVADTHGKNQIKMGIDDFSPCCIIKR